MKCHFLVSSAALSPGRSPSWEAFAGVASERVGTIAAGAPKRSGESKMSSWWFQIFFIFITTWARFPFWLTLFKWVENGWNHQLDVVTGRFTETYWNTQFFRSILGGWKPAAESDSSLHGYGANLKKPNPFWAAGVGNDSSTWACATVNIILFNLMTSIATTLSECWHKWRNQLPFC